MKPYVFDSTPLIYLTKAGLSCVFEQLNGEKYTSPLVKREVIDVGKSRGLADAFVLEKLFANAVFKVCEPADKQLLDGLNSTHGLHTADAEVLALAREYGGVAVMDDEVGRKTARVFGIDYAGSSFVLMRAVCEGLVSKEKAKQVVKDMISLGWRCSVESYIKILEAIERL